MNAMPPSAPLDSVTMWVRLIDGCTIGVPMTWFPYLLHAALEQRAQMQDWRHRNRTHWEDLDEGISVKGLLAGHRDMTVDRPGTA